MAKQEKSKQKESKKEEFIGRLSEFAMDTAYEFADRASSRFPSTAVRLELEFHPKPHSEGGIESIVTCVIDGDDVAVTKILTLRDETSDSDDSDDE